MNNQSTNQSINRSIDQLIEGATGGIQPVPGGIQPVRGVVRDEVIDIPATGTGKRHAGILKLHRSVMLVPCFWTGVGDDRHVVEALRASPQIEPPIERGSV